VYSRPSNIYKYQNTATHSQAYKGRNFIEAATLEGWQHKNAKANEVWND